jgi:hypothetical protein
VASGKHRGWLLIYELQYWVLLFVSLLFSLMTSPISAIAFAAFWGIPIWSLYRSSPAVRRGHIGWCWFLVLVSASMLITDPPTAVDRVALIGEIAGYALVVLLLLLWALYWHKSKRVKDAYCGQVTDEAMP